MINEHAATRKWRELFQGQTVSEQILVDAASLIEEMPPESPLRLRLTLELEELKQRHMNPTTKRRR